MALITATSMTGSADRVVTVTTLGASDTFVYNASRRPVLILNNVTIGTLTPLIDGDGGTTVPCPGIGDVDVSAGLTLTLIGVGATAAIPLATISGYLQGVITLTGADGIEAQILEF